MKNPTAISPLIADADSKPSFSLPLETSRCPVCQAKEFHVLRPARYESLPRSGPIEQMYSSSSDHELFDQVVECSGCSLVYLNPRIDHETALMGYASAQDETFVAQNPDRIATFRKSLRKILKLTGLPSSLSTRVIDIGCAGGAFPKAALDEGLSVIGIEPSRWLCEFARQQYGADVRAGILSDHSFDPESFHLVTLWDVIEHVSDPAVVLRDCRKIVSPDGFLVVNYPDYGSFMRRLLGWRWPFFLSVHLYYFTVKTMTALLQTAGFEPIHFSAHWQQLPLPYLLKRGSALVPGLDLLGAALGKLGASQVSLTYQMGQMLVIAKPMVNRGGPRGGRQPNESV